MYAGIVYVCVCVRTHAVDGSDARLCGEDPVVQGGLHAREPGARHVKENSGRGST